MTVKPGDKRIVKNYEDDDDPLVKGDDKQYAIQEYIGKVAGWIDLETFDSREDAERRIKDL